MSANNRVVVIGAGPAGLMAALAAAERGLDVTVCERMPHPGSKLLASGGGHCNLTNALPPKALAERFGRQWRFMLPALDLLPPEGLRQFLAARGVPTELDADGFHVFPVSRRAREPLDALLADCAKLGVKLLVANPVEALRVKNGQVVGVESRLDRLEASLVILSTGGMGYPELGGGESGYKLARQAGHEIVAPTPGLVGLKLAEHWPGRLAGIVLPDAAVSVALPKRRQAIAGRGELLFTHHGISGPAVLDISADVAELARDGNAPLALNFSAARGHADWLAEFDRWQRHDGRKQLVTLLSNHFPRAVAETLCALAGDVEQVKAAEFAAAGRERLAQGLTAMDLRAVGTEGWGRAMVTRGGVSLKQVDANTLASRLVGGLRFAGEALDLDGPCGGFNLQWAFASGRLAGS